MQLANGALQRLFPVNLTKANHGKVDCSAVWQFDH